MLKEMYFKVVAKYNDGDYPIDEDKFLKDIANYCREVLLGEDRFLYVIDLKNASNLPEELREKI